MSVKSWSTLLGALLVATAAACSSSDQTDSDADAADTTSAAAPAPSTPAPAASTATLPEGVTAEMVAAGDAQWKGGAVCVACHGPDANGTPLAPSLRDNVWLISDGSYESIVKTIDEGVAQPKEHAGVMPPRGGAPLTDQQVNELAAYIYSMSHGS